MPSSVSIRAWVRRSRCCTPSRAWTARSAIPMTVTYHDPCPLGRQGEPYVPWSGVEKKIKGQIVVYEPKRPRHNGAWGVYEPARNVLRSIPGLELVEMERTR